ncbi:DUF4249 domain-containing protein [Parabacteroides sp. OttesenSCG-928-G06]|nr:DUF4249 domain-containing protein [Parabacteroides sp. OttesenSCG-928-G06]
MKQQIYLPFFVLLLLTLTGCYKVIDLEYLKTSPRLVLNSILVAGNPIHASISRTWFHTDERPTDSISHADVKLFVNDAFKENMQWVNSDGETVLQGYYRAAYLPVAGDRIKITAAVEGFDAVSAQTIVPQMIPIDKFTMEPLPEATNMSGTYGYPYRFSVTFTDPGGENNFYFIQFMAYHPVWSEQYGGRYTDEYKWSPLLINYEDEAVFGNDLSALDKIMDYGNLVSSEGRSFTDDLFDGKTYTLRVKTNRNYNSYSSYGGNGPWYEGEYPATPPKVYFYAFLYSFSEDYYHYMKGIKALTDGTIQSELMDIGMAEPIPVMSNIENGAGILGACHPDSTGLLLEDK